MKNKKGYMKTLEAVFSVIILLIIVLTIISFNKSSSDEVPNEIQNLQEIILGETQNNESLRDFVYGSNEGGLESHFSNDIDSNRLNYDIQICDDIGNCNSRNQGVSNVFVDSIIIHGPDENNFLVRLYLWYNT